MTIADVQTMGRLGGTSWASSALHHRLLDEAVRERLAAGGPDVVVPGAADRAEVHRVVEEELCLGVVRDASREAFAEVVGRLVDDGAGGVVPGCTEIELLLGADDVGVPVSATTALHVAAAVDTALGGPPGPPRLAG